MAAIVTPESDTVAAPMQRALREAFYAAVIALGLFVLFIGLKTDQNIKNELILVQRWGLLAAVVIITAVGRFLYVGFGQPAIERAKARKAAAPAAGTSDFTTASTMSSPIPRMGRDGADRPPVLRHAALRLCHATGVPLQTAKRSHGAN